jgi:chaperonin cofactor prefoldin
MERKIIMVANKLNTRKLELEDQLEKLINSNSPIGETTDEIVKVLKEIALIDSSGQVWETYLSSITDNPNKNE